MRRIAGLIVLLAIAIGALFGVLYYAGYEPAEVVEFVQDKIRESAGRASEPARSTSDSATQNGSATQTPSATTPAAISQEPLPRMEVYGTSPVGLRVRTAPRVEDGNVIGKVFDGTQFSVVAGPESGSGYEWLRVSLEGWVAADWLRGTLTLGGMAIVGDTGTAGLRVRMQPIVGHNVLAKLFGGTHVRLIDGPVTGTAYEWWKVQLQGWSASAYLRSLGEGPARPVMMLPLSIAPERNSYKVGDTLHASFAIRNDGAASIKLDTLTVGGRLNGQCPAGACPDFTHRAATLGPGQSYTYNGTLVLRAPGAYHFFVAYHIDAPSPSEALLVDGNGWNTSIDIGPGLTHGDRVESLTVLDESGYAAGEEAALAETIDRLLRREAAFPPYLRNPDSFTSAVATVWVDMTSFVTRTNLAEKYDELYQTGVDYSSLGVRSLIYARDALNAGDMAGARRHIQRFQDFDNLSYLSFTGAAEVFDGALQAGEVLADGIRRGCETAVKFGLSFVSPEAAKVADYIYIGADFAVDYLFLDDDQSVKDAVVEIAITALFSQIRFSELGGRTIADYLENRIGAVTFPVLRKLVGNEQVQFALSRMLKEGGVIATEEMADRVAREILSRIQED